MYRRMIVGILIGSVAACGDDGATNPETSGSNLQSVTVDLDYVEVLGACEGVATNEGDFDYTITIFDDRGAASMTTSPSSLVHGLPGDRFTPPTASHTLQLLAEVGNAFEIELRGTEFDSGVPDPRFDDAAHRREHTFAGGLNWNNGSHTLSVIGGATVNPPECGLALGYRVTVE